MSTGVGPYRIAVPDDYQNVALADRSILDGRATVTVLQGPPLTERLCLLCGAP